MPFNRSRWYINLTVQTIGGEPLAIRMRKHNKIEYIYKQVTESGAFGREFLLVTPCGAILSGDRKGDLLSQYIYETEMREYLRRGREIGNNGCGVVLDMHFSVVKSGVRRAQRGDGVVGQGGVAV
jgi:hypothetical protein